MNRIVAVFLFILVLISNSLFAQEKFERESRIKEIEVPQKALQFIDSSYLKTKIRWYKEIGLKNVSFEAKFIQNRTAYSVEFDSLGFIEDIEVEVDWFDLEQAIKDMISSDLEKDCSKYKILKVQIQYSGNESELLRFITNQKLNLSLSKKYELIVRCKKQQETSLFEILFDHQGQPISNSKIVFKNSSHLEY